MTNDISQVLEALNCFECYLGQTIKVLYDNVTGCMIQRSNSCWDKVFCFSENLLDLLWDPTSIFFNGYRVTFPGVKRLRHEVQRSYPPSAEIKNEWS